MIQRKLKKYTTIPQELYVQRSADKQLTGIIEEMQRPGYVLVARQMGKTNLLFHAKRTLENAERLFAYVDLSNLYADERECYRNIINNIIEPNLNIFAPIELEIEKIRERNLPPHNEYIRCLVTILSFFQGDMVIILDEIDALRSVTYSDNIFAQIRSNYFSRTNYPVLNRLTYVLSGVVEPSELIQDKNKSPFNIGDKIYLDDFTREEHNEFIRKSELEIPDQLSDHIYKWANGNPRLTFDICSEIESHMLQTNEINEAEIDRIIAKKYLTTFDVAPVDHIRELVKSNRDIRKAVQAISRNPLVEISDETKRRLYLYGIIGSDFKSELKIKNEVIRLSLADDWLRSLDKEFTYIAGIAKYTEKSYEEAIDIFLSVIETSKKSYDIEASNYFLGLSYIKLRAYDKALKYFTHEYKSPDYQYGAKAFKGVCQIATDDATGIQTLEEATREEKSGHAYHNALLNLAVNIPDKDKAFELFERLYKSTFNSTSDTDKDSDDDIFQIRSVALFYQAEILEKKGEIEQAVDKITLALTHCEIPDSMFLLYSKSKLANTEDYDTKKQLVDTIIDNQLQFTPIDAYVISFNERHIYQYLAWLFNPSEPELFHKLLDYAHQLMPSKKNHEITYLASTVSEKRIEMLQHLLRLDHEIEEDTLADIYRDYLFEQTRDRNIRMEIFNKYLPIFENRHSIKTKDVFLFSSAIKQYYDKGKYWDAVTLCELFTQKISNIDDEGIVYESLVIYYWYTHCYSHLNRQKALEFANITLEMVRNSNGRHISTIGDAGIKAIEEQVLEIKFRAQVKTPIVSTKIYGRNDRLLVRYKDGITMEKKFKHVEEDIVSGKCEVLRLVSTPGSNS